MGADWDPCAYPSGLNYDPNFARFANLRTRISMYLHISNLAIVFWSDSDYIVCQLGPLYAHCAQHMTQP